MAQQEWYGVGNHDGSWWSSRLISNYPSPWWLVLRAWRSFDEPPNQPWRARDGTGITSLWPVCLTFLFFRYHWLISCKSCHRLWTPRKSWSRATARTTRPLRAYYLGYWRLPPSTCYVMNLMRRLSFVNGCLVYRTQSFCSLITVYPAD